MAYHTKTDARTQHRIAALFYDGCSVSGIARHYGMSQRTVRKYVDRRESMLFSYLNSMEDFLAINLDRAASATIKARTEAGQRGLLNQHSR